MRNTLTTKPWMLLAAIALLAAGYAATTVTAEEAEPATDASERRGEVFLPSEDISEDYAVAFPVDI